MSKTSYSRKLVSAKITDWVEPSFEDLFGNAVLSSIHPGSKPSESVKRHHSNKEDSSLDTSRLSKSLHRKREKPFCTEQICNPSIQPTRVCRNDPWIDQYKPESQGELAVHKKKIEEVERWLKVHIAQRQPKQGGSVLLLTGPPGCGKTATMQVLVKDLGIQVQEWTNPVISEYKKEEFKETYDHGSSFQSFTSQSQTSIFQEFLLRANKYNKLQMLGQPAEIDKRLILVEDMPNQFYRDPPCLHEVLRRFVRTGRCPLVFIISDSLSGDRHHRLLFPKEIQDELLISTISFNPVAPTSMVKVLNRIATIEASMSKGRIAIPDKAFMDLLCTGSSGDIRSAINSLQFSSFKDESLQENLFSNKKGKKSIKRDIASSKAKPRNKSEKRNPEGLQAIGGKDASLFLFRALGKILHFKRGPPTNCDLPRLPSQLSEHERDPLLIEPEAVVEKSHMPGDFFNLYLQQNYLDFFTEMDDVVRASEYLSIADFLTGDWNSRLTMSEYSASVATRGIIHSNKARVSGHGSGGVGFRPLHKPQWLVINKKNRENCSAAKSLFSSFCLPPSCLQTQLLPYLAMLTNPMRNQAQIAFIHDVGRLPLKRYFGRLKLEALTDKDPGVPDLDSGEEEEFNGPLVEKALEQMSNQCSEEDQVGASLSSAQMGNNELPSSQPQPSGAKAIMEEEEIKIEEFDSD
ncbi:cell cycle checkpoint protein RAD17 isoform X2 [Ambystoma mexicanum]|uniref:cell cycle checkpoint protein RAD17 isoform X2 n=1 Tax=Ambystoma mexicanum TaxID=8296 RepID=UPI0037E86E2B